MTEKALFDYRPYRPQSPAELKTAAKECGESPNYEQWFSLNRSQRSAYDEDRIVYETFFKHLGREEMQDFTYVEVGAFDGVKESNSRFFDQCLGWQGLVLDANPIIYPSLKRARQTSHRLHLAASCPASVAGASTVGFYKVKWSNAAEVDAPGHPFADRHERLVQVPCMSLTPILHKLFSHVTFLSIAVSGVEDRVVENIDFAQHFIDVVLVKGEASRDRVMELMKQNGYLYQQLPLSTGQIFVHPKSNLLERRERATPSFRNSSVAPFDQLHDSASELT